MSLYGTDEELEARIVAIEASDVYGRMKEADAVIAGPALTVAQNRVKGQYIELITERTSRATALAAVEAAKAAAVAAVAAVEGAASGKRKFSERPDQIGSKLDWKKKGAKGSTYDDLSAKRAYTTADTAVGDTNALN